MQTTPHNPDYKLVGLFVSTDKAIVELVYSETNDGHNKGLEAYYYARTCMQGHYYSRRWCLDRVPPKYRQVVHQLMTHVSACPAGHKINLNEI